MSLQASLEAYARSDVDKAVDALADEAFGVHTDQELSHQIADALSVEPLAVDWDSVKREVTEHTLQEQDPFGRGPIRRKGLRGTRTYRFSGTAGLWQLHPSTYGTNVPYGQIAGQSLIIGVEMTEQEAGQATAFLDEHVASIKLYLERQGADIAAFNASLQNRAQPLVEARRARLAKAAELLKRL